MDPHESHLVMRRLLHLGAMAAVAVAGVGFLTGTSTTAPARAAAPKATARPAVSSAPRYADMAEARRGANAEMYKGAFDLLALGLPPIDAKIEQNEGDRARVLEARKARRAYDGAPPTIPHNVVQMAVPDCLACHQSGVNVAGHIAPRMSHDRYDSCNQCHVQNSDSMPKRPPIPPPENSFVGLEPPHGGTRAWPGAPPTIPHRTFMRSECSSCHGPTGANGLKTTHPWRQSCNQCHASSAELDQRPPRPVGSAP